MDTKQQQSQQRQYTTQAMLPSTINSPQQSTTPQLNPHPLHTWAIPTLAISLAVVLTITTLTAPTSKSTPLFLASPHRPPSAALPPSAATPCSPARRSASCRAARRRAAAGVSVAKGGNGSVVFGHALFVCGYLLLLGIGVVLMRRRRAHARNRVAVLTGVGATDPLGYDHANALNEAFSTASVTMTPHGRRGGATAAEASSAVGGEGVRGGEGKAVVAGDEGYVVRVCRVVRAMVGLSPPPRTRLQRRVEAATSSVVWEASSPSSSSDTTCMSPPTTTATPTAVEDAAQHPQQTRRRRMDGGASDGEQVTEAEVDASGEECQCAVCLAEVVAGQRVRVLPCGHAFHTPCADLWLVTAGRNSCPLCLRPVYGEEAASSAGAK